MLGRGKPLAAGGGHGVDGVPDAIPSLVAAPRLNLPCLPPFPCARVKTLAPVAKRRRRHSVVTFLKAPTWAWGCWVCMASLSGSWWRPI